MCKEKNTGSLWSDSDDVLQYFLQFDTLEESLKEIDSEGEYVSQLQVSYFELDFFFTFQMVLKWAFKWSCTLIFFRQ